ncbi:MAG: serine--tRNA ligase [Longimicrobiales bacterium]|jgi:seryl-tRNA synthetase|nr:serine--tRNA ligase [Longimicrobiales bacterium]
MLDIRRLRAEPDAVKEALRKRDASFTQAVDAILSRDEARREAIGEANELKARRNSVSKQVGELKRSGQDASAIIEQTRALGQQISDLDDMIRDADDFIRQHLLLIPNEPHPDVPVGGEEDNEVLSTWGTPATFDFEAQPHWSIGEDLGILDMPRGSKISGSGFPVLVGRGARLQRGLINFFLDVHTEEHDYTEVRVPYMVSPESMTATGQLPKFAEESYQSEKDDLWLVPTAEVPVTNLHRDELLTVEDLPRRYTAYSPCFRREAGAAGKDTRGLLRVHQFDKVELVRFETPERGLEALEELTREVETLLERLGLHHRRVLLATGDLGQSGAMTYDLEVWAPGVEKWLEVSSCTTFTDYQARRGNIRFRRAQAEKPEFVHTLNGSGLALPRVVASLLETYQEADGSVSLPEALHPYVGAERLTAPT